MFTIYIYIYGVICDMACGIYFCAVDVALIDLANYILCTLSLELESVLTFSFIVATVKS